MEILKELWDYYIQNSNYVFEQTYLHLMISVNGVLLAVIVGIPLGILMQKNRILSTIIITTTSVIQTIPMLAILAMLMLYFGLGSTTVIFTIFLYSLLPVIQNTHASIKNVDIRLLEVGKAMGMTKLQLLLKVQLPLSITFIIGGIKTALIVAIGLTTIGAFIGGGGLGSIIIRGTNVTDGTAIILAGAIPAALLALLSERILTWFGSIFFRFKKLEDTNISL